jgi:hypothetical protein
LAALNGVDTIYHGLPERLLRPNLRPGSYLAFLGRFTPSLKSTTSDIAARPDVA